MLRLRTNYSRCEETLLIKNQPCKSGQKYFVKVEKVYKTLVTSLTNEKVGEVRELIWSDRGLTVHEIAKKCHMSYGSVQSIYTEKFGMRCVCAKLVPRF